MVHSKTQQSNPLREEYTRVEEVLHSLTHGIGALFSIAGLVILVLFAVSYGDAWHVVSFSIFGASMIILYLASTLYHGSKNPRAKKILKTIDHSAIYFLIAGSYTPFVLVSLRGAWGWSLFGVVWGLAILGIVLKCVSMQSFKKISYAIYFLMGWLCIIALQEMIERIAAPSLTLLVFGGIAYTVGFVFYAWEKVPYNHLIWHLFVLCGSSLHYFSVLYIL